MRTIHGIANPHAARGRNVRFFDDIVEYFEDHDIRLELSLTDSPKHAVEIAQSLADSGKNEIIALGGDGTSFEAINGIMMSERREEIRYGILPLGTGNSFLNDYDLFDWETCADLIVEGKTQPIDLAQVQLFEPSGFAPFFYHNMSGYGLIARACDLRHTRYKFLGRYAYHAAFFNLVASLKAYPMHITVDGGTTEEIVTSLLGVCNSQYTGHGMHISPLSRVDDGLLDCMYTEDVSALELLKLFSTLPSGAHMEHPKVIHRRVRSIEIKMKEIDHIMVDGEVIEATHLRIDIIPQALQVFLPEMESDDEEENQIEN